MIPSILILQIQDNLQVQPQELLLNQLAGQIMIHKAQPVLEVQLIERWPSQLKEAWKPNPE